LSQVTAPAYSPCCAAYI